jgi:hypothetical protein
VTPILRASLGLAVLDVVTRPVRRAARKTRHDRSHRDWRACPHAARHPAVLDLFARNRALIGADLAQLADTDPADLTVLITRGNCHD